MPERDKLWMLKYVPPIKLTSTLVTNTPQNFLKLFFYVKQYILHKLRTPGIEKILIAVGTIFGTSFLAIK